MKCPYFLFYCISFLYFMWQIWSCCAWAKPVLQKSLEKCSAILQRWYFSLLFACCSNFPSKYSTCSRFYEVSQSWLPPCSGSFLLGGAILHLKTTESKIEKAVVCSGSFITLLMQLANWKSLVQSLSIEVVLWACNFIVTFSYAMYLSNWIDAVFLYFEHKVKGSTPRRTYSNAAQCPFSSSSSLMSKFEKTWPHCLDLWHDIKIRWDNLSECCARKKEESSSNVTFN